MCSYFPSCAPLFPRMLLCSLVRSCFPSCVSLFPRALLFTLALLATILFGFIARSPPDGVRFYSFMFPLMTLLDTLTAPAGVLLHGLYATVNANYATPDHIRMRAYCLQLAHLCDASTKRSNLTRVGLWIVHEITSDDCIDWRYLPI